MDKINELKESIINSLNLISDELPHLTQDINMVSQALLNIRLKSRGSMAGDKTLLLQNEWKNIQDKFQEMISISKSDVNYQHLEEPVKLLRDYLKKTVGKELFNNPTGSHRS
jgi:DNA-directed RNA polymerase beta' subunit